MDDQPQGQASSPKKSNSPMMWIAAAIIIIIVVVGAAFYYKSTKKAASEQAMSQENTSQMAESSSMPEGSSSPDAMMVDNSLVMTKNNAQKGDYLVDSKGMTLYIFDKDSPGKSTCSAACLAAWPIYEAPSATPANLPANFGVVKATNGKYMYTYKEMPLYYYAQDKAPGDTTGDGVGGVWHLVKP